MAVLFSDGVSEDRHRFREEVARWLRLNVPAEPLPPMYTEEGFTAHSEWEKQLHRANYAALHWPQQYGGGGADMETQALFQEEYIRAQAPARLNRLGLGLVGPTIIAYGTEEQKKRWLPGIINCEEIWCQGFSEPGAGSDLAAVATKATFDGDVLVVNGQKSWTSLAIFSNWMSALVRTGTEGKKHHGLTYLMIPMNLAGLDIRPLRQLHGEPGFAEVFFTDVRVPIENVLGEVGDGWRLAMATLAFERWTGLGDHARFSMDLQELIALARHLGLDDSLVRDDLTNLYVETEAFRIYMQNMVRDNHRNDPPTEASMTKLYWSNLESRIFEAQLEVLGADGELEADVRAGVSQRHRRYWHARAAKIFAGTNEIQKNIIAQRILGLPRP